MKGKTIAMTKYWMTWGELLDPELSKNISFLMSSITSNLTVLRFDGTMINTDYNLLCL
jgi:hypothetical protein